MKPISVTPFARTAGKSSLQQQAFEFSDFLGHILSLHSHSSSPYHPTSLSLLILPIPSTSSEQTPALAHRDHSPLCRATVVKFGDGEDVV